jgi:hypothetical protein
MKFRGAAIRWQLQRALSGRTARQGGSLSRKGQSCSALVFVSRKVCRAALGLAKTGMQLDIVGVLSSESAAPRFCSTCLLLVHRLEGVV